MPEDDIITDDKNPKPLDEDDIALLKTYVIIFQPLPLVLPDSDFCFFMELYELSLRLILVNFFAAFSFFIHLSSQY